MKRAMLAWVSVLLCMGFMGCQPSKTVEVPTVDGVKLVQDLWAGFKSGNQEVITNWVADGFQSVHASIPGYKGKEEEIQLIMGLNLGDYTLDNFHATQNGNVSIVSYTVATTETVDGKVLPTDPAGRLSVFMYNGKEWKWISHVNLNP